MTDTKVLVYIRVADGDYLLGASTSRAAKNETFWPDYYESNGFESETREVYVSQEVALKLVRQGSDDQYYSDGYAAFQAINNSNLK